MRNRQQLRQLGFTIVEILVVIVVISILVAIAMVSYGDYQEKARDAERRSDLQQAAAAIKSYANWKNTHIEQGSGCGGSGATGGNGSGWFNVSSADSSTYATNSIADCLASAGFLKSAKDVIDPTGCKSGTGGVCGSSSSLPVRAYMKVTCPVGGVKTTYLMAALETQPADNATIDALCGKNWGTSYGMNYYVTVR